jgi:hypothetical protein
MVTVTVTPLGQQVVDFVQGLRVGYLAHATGVFDDAELATLADLLGRLAESMLGSFEPWLHAVTHAPQLRDAGGDQTTGMSPESDDTTSRTTALAIPAS